MKKHSPIRVWTVFVIVSCLFPRALFPQFAEKYFDGAGPKSAEIRLTILDPSEESLRAVIGLRTQGFLPDKGLIVIGIFHAEERANYLRAMEYVEKNKMDWMKFHKLTGEINARNLFEKNPLTADFRDIFEKSDGIIFLGGYDIPPVVYHQKTGLLTQIQTPYRHFLEISFVFHLLGGFQNESLKPFLDSHPQFPVMGICLGSQTLNVGSGGTLFQDVWSEIYGKKYLEDVVEIGRENLHKNPWARLYPEEKLYSVNLHPIRLEASGIFVKELGYKKTDRPYVRCGHHQAIARLGKGMKVAATSIDGKVIDAIEHEKYPNILGVQFHPEDPVLWDDSLKSRFTPQERDRISLRSVLENNPPSFAFHAGIWSWFRGKLDAFHRAK